jgi:hypothetical protein
VWRTAVLFSARLVVVKGRARYFDIAGERFLIRRSVEIKLLLHAMLRAVLANRFA